jgi:hypothetical protein
VSFPLVWSLSRDADIQFTWESFYYWTKVSILPNKFESGSKWSTSPRKYHPREAGHLNSILNFRVPTTASHAAAPWFRGLPRQKVIFKASVQRCTRWRFQFIFPHYISFFWGKNMSSSKHNSPTTKVEHDSDRDYFLVWLKSTSCMLPCLGSWLEWSLPKIRFSTFFLSTRLKKHGLFAWHPFPRL